MGRWGRPLPSGGLRLGARDSPSGDFWAMGGGGLAGEEIRSRIGGAGRGIVLLGVGSSVLFRRDVVCCIW